MLGGVARVLSLSWGDGGGSQLRACVCPPLLWRACCDVGGMWQLGVRVAAWCPHRLATACSWVALCTISSPGIWAAHARGGRRSSCLGHIDRCDAHVCACGCVCGDCGECMHVWCWSRARWRLACAVYGAGRRQGGHHTDRLPTDALRATCQFRCRACVVGMTACHPHVV